MGRAISTNPESYLTKPIKKNDVIAAIKLVLLKQQVNSYSFKSGHLIVNELFSDILYFKAEGNYVDIFTSNKKYTIRRSLSKCQEELPENAPFVQTHRSYLVNNNHITQKTASAVYLGSIEIPLSRSYAKALK
jgi:DNA-binding LytR/AlgR family response regulator